jgi:ABC-type nickel/cobalt efflux system permease component RcnA
MLSAIALHRVGFGLLLIVAFSLGLARVLTAIGVLLVHAGRFVNRLPGQNRLLRFLPTASALFITIAGIGITWEAFIQTGLLSL